MENSQKMKLKEFNGKDLNYLKKYTKDLQFTKYFYGINPSKKDYKQIKKFMQTLELKKKELTLRQISKKLDTPKGTIENWIAGRSYPLIIRILQNYTEIDLPDKNKLWLSINTSKGGIFLGPWIQVPRVIRGKKDITKVLNQISPLNKRKNEFNKENNIRLKLFAYLLGMLIGDTSKHGIKRNHRITRRIQLRLTKKYRSNKNLGEFTCLCANNIGIRMKRKKDCPKGKRNTHPFYAWHSQCSPLIDWTFTKCLGLTNEEKTTYHPVKMDWILKTPKCFRIWFLQGLSDSDGYIDISTYQAGIITGPNDRLVQNIFSSLDVHSNKSYLQKGTLSQVKIRLEDANSLPLFNPYVNLYRYKLMKKVINSPKFNHHWPDWLGKEVNRYIKSGFSSTKIMHTILKKHNLVVRQGGIYKRMKKLKEESVKCLGIESTALD